MYSPPSRIIIIGNGFGGIYALKNLHKFFCGNKNARISILGERNYFLFTPLLHEVATGGINPENIIESVQKVLGCCIDKFHLGKAKKISLANKTVEIKDEGGRVEILFFDYLILAPGAQTNFYNIPGAEEYSFALKSLEDAVAIKNQIILRIEQASLIKDRAERKKKLAFAVVGGGPTGVEMAAELQEFIKDTFSRYYAREIIDDACVTLVQGGPELVPQFGKKFQERSLKVLRKKGIVVLLGKTVKEVTATEIFLSDGSSIGAETIIWVAGIKPAELDFDKEVSKSPSGQLVVNEYLELDGHNSVFALGDAAFFKPGGKHSLNRPLPALAQVATKEAWIVAKNIKLSTEGQALKPFTYHSAGTLMSLGKWMALGEISLGEAFTFAFSGPLTWFIWRTVYLFKLLSWEKKFRVAIDWTINIFLPRDISKL